MTDDLEIHLLLAENENNNVRFDTLPNRGSSNFTLAMNVTNITDAQLVMTFPVKQGLRVADLGFFDDGVLNEELAAPSSEFLPDGRLRIVADVDYPIGSIQWSVNCLLISQPWRHSPMMHRFGVQLRLQMARLFQSVQPKQTWSIQGQD